MWKKPYSLINLLKNKEIRENKQEISMLLRDFF